MSGFLSGRPVLWNTLSLMFRLVNLLMELQKSLENHSSGKHVGLMRIDLPHCIGESILGTMILF